MIDELLRAARPEVAAPDPAVVLRARRTLLRTALAGRARRRYAIRAAVAVTAAATVLAVIGVVQTPEHGASPAAAALLEKSAASIEAGAPTTSGQFIYRKWINTYWGYGPSPSDPTKENTEPFVEDNVETWIPVDEKQPLIQRTTEPDGTVSFAVVPQDQTDAWKLYQQHPKRPAAMLDALRDLASRSGSEDPDDNGVVWGTAFSLLADPQTPDDISADVLRALAHLDGVAVIDRHAEIAGRVGVAIRYDEKYAPAMVFDPETGALLGFRGFPERSKNWVGPDEPTWTLVFESKVVDSAPVPNQPGDTD